ncbi:MAG: terminase small subunit, partial [Eubacteriales bacterium]|nr:terminase small subunit [Eubacteriales bacterium]
YNCSYEVAMINGCRMLRNAKIKKEIERLKKERLKLDFLSESDIFQKYMDIAFGDIGDYVKFGKKQVPQWAKDKKGKWIPVIDPNTNMQKIVEYSYVDLKESIEVDTSIISEVSEGKNGIKIKLADRMKALDWLSNHMNMATDEQKARLELLKAQKAKLESDGNMDSEATEQKIDNIASILSQMEPVKDEDISD